VKLPPGVVQPFELRYYADDLHVMAFFTGHPTYESVEAMVRFSAGREPTIRAIVTRHDQSQIDHVNDRAMVRTAATERETCFRDIEFDETSTDRAARARIAFDSIDGERVELDVVSAGPPDAARGGLSSPGTHSLHSVLPLMVRGSSALAAPESRVAIDGVVRPIPVKLRTPTFVAHDGYFTRSHHMAIVRAGEVVYSLRRTPAEPRVGEEWRLATVDGERCYRIVEARAGSLHLLRADAPSETMRLEYVDDRVVDLRSVRLSDDRDPHGYVELSFHENEQFSIGMDGIMGLVQGDVVPRDDGFVLRPTQPDWATLRAVRVAVSTRNDRIVVATTIGSSDAEE